MNKIILIGGGTKPLVHGNVPDTAKEVIDQYVTTLKSHQNEWIDCPIQTRIKLLEELNKNILKYRDEWGQLDAEGRKLPENHPERLNSYRAPGIAGTVIKHYIYTLKQIKANGGQKPYISARQQGDRVVVDTSPRKFIEKLLFHDVRAEIWLKRGTKLADLPTYQASFYKDPNYKGGLSLIMPAGNNSAATLADLLQKLIMEKKVCIVKMHPVVDYMTPLMEKILAPFIEAGFVRIVNGGSEIGRYLAQHPLVDDIQMTGSDKTFESIVFGAGQKGEENKEQGTIVNEKPISCELSTVNPVIVVPGDWTEEDLEYHARNIFSMIATYNAYACVGARMLILPKKWDKGDILINKLEALFRKSVLPVKYYPGTDDAIREAEEAYPSLEIIGTPTKDQQPWLMAKNLDPTKKEIAFEREFWAAFIGQTYIDGEDKGDYLLNAVKFANEKLWGTFSATIIIDPESQKELTNSGIFLQAIDQLRYGMVATNAYPGLGLLLGTNPWGAYPGATINDIQSGNSFMLNVFLLDGIEKSVIFAPFKGLPLANWKPGIKPLIGAASAFSKLLITGSILDFYRLIRARKGAKG